MPGALGRLEDPGQRFCLRSNRWNRRFGGSPSRMCFRYTLLMRRCFQCLAGKAYKYPVAIVDQVFDNLVEHGAPDLPSRACLFSSDFAGFFWQESESDKKGTLTTRPYRTQAPRIAIIASQEARLLTCRANLTGFRLGRRARRRRRQRLSGCSWNPRARST